ncbi:MAG: LamG-like jellyroll fold domain-containing protein [Pirellula sp.]
MLSTVEIINDRDRRFRWFRHVIGMGLGLIAITAQAQSSDTASSKAASFADLKKSLTLHAAFDSSVDANFSKGDASLWSSVDMNKRETAVKGLPSGERVVLEKSGGRFGGSLRFMTAKGPMVFYRGKENILAPKTGWSGTISFWLSTDPLKDLAPGFCDPIQITSKQWDDAAMFVEFEKRPAGIPFRLGVYADKNVWNPNGRKFEDIPPAERPLASVEQPPFLGDKWVHVVFVFEHFNTNEPNGQATLFLNGKKASAISKRTQTFTWDVDQSAIMLGLGYVGKMDDLAIFNRALTDAEVQMLGGLQRGVAELSSP